MSPWNGASKQAKPRSLPFAHGIRDYIVDAMALVSGSAGLRS